MMMGCPDPVLVKDPDKANAEEINNERLSVADWGACYKGKFDDWVTWATTILKRK